MKKKLFKLLGLCLLATSGFTQDFMFKAALKPLNENGLHRVLLGPEIRSHSRPGLDDLRLRNEKGQEIPYALIYEAPRMSSDDFVAMHQLSATEKKGGYTQVIFEDNSDGPLNNITLNINNTSIAKTFTLSGSADRISWYGILENQWLSGIYDVNRTTAYKTIYFPPVHYRYYKLVLNDSVSAPVKILGIGNYKGNIRQGAMTELLADSMHIENDPTQKTTNIHIKFPSLSQLDQLVLNISGPSYFRREARIYIDRKRNIKGREEKYRETYSDIILASDQESVYDLQGLETDNLTIVISNNDNPPLNIMAANFKQWAVYLVADLDKREKYFLYTGNDKLKPPVYDLVYFKEKMQGEIPSAQYDRIENITAAPSPAASVRPWQQPWFLWTCIGIGALVLGYFSYRMVKEVEK
jgi:hypothetical protein